MKNKGKRRKKGKERWNGSEEFHLRFKYNEDIQWHREILNKEDTPEIYETKKKKQSRRQVRGSGKDVSKERKKAMIKGKWEGEKRKNVRN